MLGSISTAAGGFRYSAGVISIAEGKFHCPLLSGQCNRNWPFLRKRMSTLALVIEIPQPMAAGFIYIHITALAELYRNLPQAAVEITPVPGVSKSSQSSVKIEYR
ncbi:MAG: hypothetical protein IKW19_07085 [Akkermansia sp.]|nr:hypothetical protein [Akkermansia sp.]